MSFLNNLFKRKKKDFIPANPKDDSKAARVVEVEEINEPYSYHVMSSLPKGFTPNKHHSRHFNFNSQASKFIPRTKYNEPVAIKASQRRKTLTLK